MPEIITLEGLYSYAIYGIREVHSNCLFPADLMNCDLSICRLMDYCEHPTKKLV